MRAITISVGFDDLLSLTLPYNRHHFSDYLIVTSLDDTATQEVGLANGASVHCTNSFSRYGPNTFAKWLALEEGLTLYGRDPNKVADPWLCIIDADVLWPKVAPLELVEGCLYSPLRRMYPSIPRYGEPLPPENRWINYPIHRNVIEWAGYTQIFHLADPHLGLAPWHEVDWLHAGGADSFLQMRWPVERKKRPDWQVLHLGEAGVNWLGRVSMRMDGTMPYGSKEKRQTLRRLIRARTTGPDRFKAEKYG